MATTLVPLEPEAFSPSEDWALNVERLDPKIRDQCWKSGFLLQLATHLHGHIPHCNFMAVTGAVSNTAEDPTQHLVSLC